MILSRQYLVLGRIWFGRNSDTPSDAALRSSATWLLLLAFALSASVAHGQTGEWVWQGGGDVANTQPGVYGTQGVPAQENVPGSRNYIASATDNSGNFWLFGGSGVADPNGSPVFNDLWEYSSKTNQWAWRSGGKAMAGVYGTLGVAAKDNLPGGRFAPVLWTDQSGNVWLFGGYGYTTSNSSGPLNDLWKFDVSTSEWIWMGGSALPNDINTCPSGVYGTQGVSSPVNVPGGREGATSWTDSSGNLWLFGGLGCYSQGIEVLLNDLWEFNPITAEWTWISGSSFDSSAAANFGSVGVSGTMGTSSAGNTPSSRWLMTNMGVDGSGNLWLFGGIAYDSDALEGDLNDLWEFNPTTKQWTWQSGSLTLPPGSSRDISSVPGVYGSPGQFAAGNVPGGRSAGAGSIDSKGKLRLFGGTGNDTALFVNLFNDLWLFDPVAKEWAWISGSSDTLPCVDYLGQTCLYKGAAGSYGTLGAAAANNVPGGRYGAAGWTDGSGNLWIFGGPGVDSAGTVGNLNDLWEFQTSAAATTTTPVFGTMTFSPAATELVGTSQAITISDTLSYSDAQPKGAVTYVLNGVSYSATCTAAGSPETCAATVPAATIAALAAGPYTVGGSFAGDNVYSPATAASGTFTVTAAGACTIPDSPNGSINIAYFTLAESDKDGKTLPQGLSSNYVLPMLGANGLPLYNPDASTTNGAEAAPKDLLADGELTWWSPALNNGGQGGTSDVVETGTGVVQLPFNNGSFYPPNGSGSNDANGFQTAVLTGTLVAAASESVGFTIASDDMAFVYLDGQIACDDGGIHGPTPVPCTTSTIAAGTHTLQLFYADLNVSGAALNFSLTTSNAAVGAGNQLVFGSMAFSPAATEPLGTSQTITISDTLTYSGPIPTGSVAYTLNGVSYLATCTTAGSPETCTAQVPAATIAALQAGAYPVNGSFAGDCNYSKAAATSGTFTITKQSVVFGTMTFSPAATEPFGTSQTVTISDTLSYPDAQPTGAVTYGLNGVSYTATCTTGGSPETCSAAVPATTIAALSAAAYTVKGSFAGDVNYEAATATNGTFTITAASTTTTLTASATSLSFGQQLVLTATVSSPSGGIPAGTVTFLNGAAVLGAAALNGAGVATLTLTPAVGTYSITAGYGGSSNDLPSSSSPAIAVKVIAAPTVVTLTSSLNPAPGGSPVTFNIGVQAGGGTPTGQVTLTDGSALLATLFLGAEGTATFTTSSLAIGPHPLTASYAANTNYTAGLAMLTEVILPPPDFSISTGGPLTLVTQHHGPVAISVTPINEFSGDVTLSCGTLPAYVRCEWGKPTKTQTSIAVAGESASTQLTIDTSAVIDYLSSSERSDPNAEQFIFAGVAFPGLLLLFRRRKAVVRLMLSVFVVGSMLHLSGCSSRYPDSTPPGTYTISIVGSSGTIQHSAVLSLVVTK